MNTGCAAEMAANLEKEQKQSEANKQVRASYRNSGGLC